MDEQTIDFGEKYQFTQINRDVTVWNHSASAIVFQHDKVPNNSVSLTFDQPTLAPGKSATLHLKVALEDRIGSVAFHVPIETKEIGKTEHYEIVVKGYVDSILDDMRPGLDFGVVDATVVPVEKTISLTSSSDPQFRITRVLDAPDFVTVRINSNAHDLQVKPKKFDVLGYNKGFIRVALDSKQQSQASIAVLMDIHGNVVSDQNPLSFGLQRPKTAHPVRLQLTSRDGKAFNIGKPMPNTDAHISVDATTCLPKSRPDCRAYLFSIKKDQPHGQIFGKVGFALPDTHQILDISLGGIYLADDTEVHSLNSTSELKAGAKQSAMPRTVDLSQTLKKAVSEQTQVAPPGEGPLLKWQVANEAGMYGYAIYRSDAVDGHFVRVNDAIVKAKNGGDDTTADYQWRDTSATKGKEYWYYISIFYNSGKKVQLSGPQKVVAK